MPDRAAVVAEARRWLDTPFHHQAHSLGLGVDCAGVVRGVMIALGLRSADVSQWPRAGEFTGYGRVPDGRSLLEACDTYLTRIAAAALAPGDVVVVRWGAGDPQHMGIVGDYRHGGLSLIHAESRRHRRVVETRLLFGREMRLVQAYAIPGVA